METKLTEQQSLAVISEMINRARNNVQKGSANMMIFWGYLVAFIAILNVVFLYVLSNPNQSFWVWCLAIPGGVFSFFIEKRIDRDAIVKTQIDNIISGVWRAFGISVFLFIVIIFWTAYGLGNHGLFFLITPVIMLMIAIALYVTAKACRFKPFYYGTFIMWIGAICCVVCLFTLRRADLQFIILAISMITSFVIPGYSLNRKAKDHV